MGISLTTPGAGNGAGGGDATAANQVTQIGLETAIDGTGTTGGINGTDGTNVKLEKPLFFDVFNDGLVDTWYMRDRNLIRAEFVNFGADFNINSFVIAIVDFGTLAPLGLSNFILDTLTPLERISVTESQTNGNIYNKNMITPQMVREAKATVLHTLINATVQCYVLYMI